MVARLAGEDALYLVVNAATKDADFAYIAEQLGGVATLTPQTGSRACWLCRGRRPKPCWRGMRPRLPRSRSCDVKRMTVAGAPAIVGRTGYTGEDGYEIALDAERCRTRRARAAGRAGGAADRPGRARFAAPGGRAVPLWPRHRRDHRPGRGQSGLGDRQAPQDGQGFSGRRADHGPSSSTAPRRKRVGLRPEGRAPAREGAEIADKTGRIIGRVTSGGFGPSLNAPVAMGYVETAFAADGTELDLMVRGKPIPARVAPMPFVPNGYKRT